MLDINKIYKKECLDFIKQIDNDLVDLVIIDPPYNVGKNIIGDKLDIDEYLKFINNCIKEIFRILKDGGSFYIFCSHKFMSRIDCFIQDVGFNVRNRIIWVKRSGSRGTKRGFIPEYEPIIYSVKGKEFIFNSDEVRVEYSESSKNRKDSFNKKKNYYWKPNPLGKLCPDVWLDIGQLHFAHPERIVEKGDTVIETQKPLKLIKRIVKVSSNKGDLVLDCFMGSGTTAVACKQLGRNFIGCDISEKYVKIANKRLEQETLLKIQGGRNSSQP